jgi:hypothetical protein
MLDERITKKIMKQQTREYTQIQRPSPEKMDGNVRPGQP